MRVLGVWPIVLTTSDQIGQSCERVILGVAESFSIAAQQPIHLRGADRRCGRGQPAAPDPGDLKAEMFCTRDIKAVGRDKQHLIGLESKSFSRPARSIPDAA